MQNTLIDNSNQFRLVNYLNELVNDTKCNEICIATGYWDLKGTKLLYDALLPFFERGGKMRLLIGEEPTVRSYQLQTDIPKEEKFPDFYIQRDVNQLTEEYAPVAQMLLQYSNIDEQDNSQIQIRVYGQKGEEKKFLHAKCYIFLGEGQAYGILGSSNFTERGLQDNAELNHLEVNPNSVTGALSQYNPYKTHLVWFNEMWKDESCEEWTGKFIKDILYKAPVAKDLQLTEQPKPQADKSLTPYELYIKLLQDRFGTVIDKDLAEQIKSYLPRDYNTLEYQIDAVKQCYSIMQEHGGFMLADVVGLGKTIVGTLLIKHFLNNSTDAHPHKVLIVTPPAIQSAWVDTITEFDQSSDDVIMPFVTFVTTGSVNKFTDDDVEDIEDESIDEIDTSNNVEFAQDDFGLIIIDESHKFRNSTTQMYKALDDLISKIFDNTGAYPYIGLLSATPQNNRPDDIKNQIYLFERDHEQSTLKKAEGGNIARFFQQVGRDYNEIIKAKEVSSESQMFGDFDVECELSKEERQQKLKDISMRVRDSILADILIRRTRTDIEKYYVNDIDLQGIHFPKISGPHELTYKMNSTTAQLFADTMSKILFELDRNGKPIDNPQHICYFRYRTIQYFNDTQMAEKRYQFGSMKIDRFSLQLAKIMQILLVKRLESSFTAFKTSLQNLLQYTHNMIQMWEDDCIFICPELNINEELNLDKKNKDGNKVTRFDCYEEIRKKIKKLNDEGNNEKGQNAEYKRSDFKEEYIELLHRDEEQISLLLKRWGLITYDPKLEVFIKNLPLLFNKENNPSQKLVIFSEAVDTVKQLEERLQNEECNGEPLDGHILVINSQNRKEKQHLIQENFDANYKGKWKDDYKIIITTEVLAEGINLHRANTIVNYDTPWNSTRLMQRIGRVNRIGSSAEYIYVYNFIPSAQVNDEIQLVNKAYTKLQSFHTMFGEDSKIYNQDEQVEHYDLNAQVNGEESVFEKYIYRLKQYKELNPERYDYLSALEEGTSTALPNTGGKAYMLVKTPRMKGLYVEVDSELNAKIISTLEMLEAFENNESSCGLLPNNWQEICDAATDRVKDYFIRFNTHRNNDQKIRAYDIIQRLYNDANITPLGQKLLQKAKKKVRDGNTDIIKKIIRIDNELSQQDTLFNLSQEDIEAILKRELEKLLSQAEQRIGTPEVYLALQK